MTFREKSAWICLVTTIFVFVPYFVNVFGLLAQPEHEVGVIAGSVGRSLVAAIAFQTVLAIAAHIFVGVRSRHDKADERDIAIESKSFKAAYYVLSVTVCGGVLPLMVWGQTLSIAFVGQRLLLCFVLAEGASYLSQIINYRRWA